MSDPDWMKHRGFALRLAGRTVSRSEFASLIASARARLERQGLAQGDRIAIELTPSAESLALLFGALAIGALVCPLSAQLGSLERAARIKRLSPRLVLSETSCEQFPPGPKSPWPGSMLFFTSGTTAEPKLALLSLQGLLHSAAVASEALDLREEDEWLLSLPLHHVGGLGIVLRCLVSGATLSMDARQCTHISYVPTQLHRAWPVGKRLRCLLLGGAPIREVPPPLPIVCSYGMTETGSLVLKSRQAPPFLGEPLRGTELRIASDGELFVRGASLFQGYWQNGVVETPFDEAGWFGTRDLSAWDANKGYAIVGRKDNQFISGGENIQPEEIERALCTHPAVIDAVVVPQDDAEWGARPVVFLCAQEPLTLSEVRDFLSERLARYKLPVAVFEWPESEGKPNRRMLSRQV